jgi:hypothetical protein
MLFNGIFDMNLVPHHFFGPLDGIKYDQYNLRSVINSISFYGWRNQFGPLNTELSAVASRYREESKELHREGGTETPCAPGPEHLSSVSDREIFYSPLLYTAMEHFCNIASAFGLTYYNDGLEISRKYLLREIFSARIGEGTGEIFPMSTLIRGEAHKTAIHGSVEKFASYCSLLRNKLPSLVFLASLVEDTARTSRPVAFMTGSESRHVSERLRESPTYREWLNTSLALNVTLEQFRRQIDNISLDIKGVVDLLANESENRILSELTETRKIHELASVTNIGMSTDSDASTIRAIAPMLTGVLQELSEQSKANYDLISRRIEKVTFFLLIAGALYGTAIWLIDKWVEGKLHDILSNNYTKVILTLSLFLAFLFYFLIIRSRDKSNAIKPSSSSADVQFVTGIFDYASLREEVTADLNKLIDEWERKVRPLDVSCPPIGTATYNKTEEVPVPGIVRTKYTFTSDPLETSKIADLERASYVISFTIERHFASTETALINMRLVTRYKKGMKIDQYVRDLVKHYTYALLPSRSPAYYARLFEKNFGFVEAHSL